MMPPVTHFARFALALGALCVLRMSPAAQAPSDSGVVGVGNFSHIVSSLDRSLQFYRDVIGLQPDGAPRTFSGDLAMKVGNTPGAQSLFTTLRVPGSPLGVEIIEYQNIERRAARPRYQDPGAATMGLTVVDIEAVVARAKKAGVHINTSGTTPKTLPDGTRAVLMQDPDGFFVQLIQLPPTSPPAHTAGVTGGGGVEVVVGDVERTVRLYREVLGFDVRADPSAASLQLLGELTGIAGARFTRSVTQVPGTSFPVSFVEVAGVDRTPLRTRFQDPGTPVLQLRVRGIDAITNSWKKAGGEVITAGGEPVNLGNLTLAVLRDPNNLMLELISAP
jgi:catechol 2,3-dioxygenase-like lactoylglutathione lyase family enzyme